MNESKEEKSEAEDAPDRSPETEIDQNDSESLLTEIDEDGHENERLVEVRNRKKRKKQYILMAILLGVVASVGFFWWFAKDGSGGGSVNPSPNQRVEQKEKTVKSVSPDASSMPEMVKRQEKSIHAEIPEHAKYGLADKLEKVDGLRNELLRKQEELRALKQYYHNRTEEMGDEILDEKRDKGISTFQQALASKYIELRLRTIKRRQQYIQQLDTPLDQLVQGSEELLYMKRLAGIQIQMAAVVKGMDMAGLEKRMDMAIEKEANGIANLGIDTAQTDVPSLEEIWKELIHGENAKRQSEDKGQTGKRSEKGEDHSQKQDDINSDIWQEIRVGNLSRKHQLTKLSLDAAKCLSQWEEGKDLFLNGITEITASIAGQLSQWKGEWICLNGLTELSPEAAEALSQWRGTRLSLNGLIELSPGRQSISLNGRESNSKSSGLPQCLPGRTNI